MTTRTRRYNLDRTQREFLTNTIFPMVTRQLEEHADNMRKVAAQGGVEGLITPTAAKMIAEDHELRLSRLNDIVVQLGGDMDDEEDDA